MLLLFGCATTQTKQVSLILPKDDPSSYQRFRNLSGMVAPYFSIPFQSFSLGIVDTEEVNAFVDAEHKILYITRAALKEFNDQELLCIFAHEWAHVEQGHYGKRVVLSESITILSEIADIFFPGSGSLNVIVNPIATKTFSRSQEKEADIEAVQVVYERLNISPDIYMSVLEKLQNVALESGGSRGGLLDSHPSLEERIEHVRTWWAERRHEEDT